VQPWAEPDRAASPVAERSAGPRVGVLRPTAPAAPRHGLAPLATFEIVDQATAFWRRRVGVVVAVTLVATLPVQALSALACRGEQGCAGVDPNLLGVLVAFDTGEVGAATMLVVWLLAALSAQFAATAVAHLVTAERLGNPLTAGTSLRLALRQAPAVLVAWTLGHLLLVVSAVTVVGPFAVMALLLVTTPAIAVERIGPLAGLKRSWRLGRARFWPVLGVAVASGLVATLLGLAFSLLPLGVGALGPLERWSWLFEAAAAQLQVLVAVPLTAAAATLAYLDLRVRAEGLDLQMDAATAFAPPGEVSVAVGD
jgi:hypothetical protein